MRPTWRDDRAQNGLHDFRNLAVVFALARVRVSMSQVAPLAELLRRTEHKQIHITCYEYVSDVLSIRACASFMSVRAECERFAERRRTPADGKEVFSVSVALVVGFLRMQETAPHASATKRATHVDVAC